LPWTAPGGAFSAAGGISIFELKMLEILTFSVACFSRAKSLLLFSESIAFDND
jgi:hypothetical protein